MPNMSASTATSSFRVAVIRNYVGDYRWGALNVASFIRRVRMFAADADVDIYAPISGDEFPDPTKYDLVILSGGPVSLLKRPLPQWVMDLLQYVRTVVKDHPETKLMGLCWGHLAISMALGGRVGLIENGIIGVKRYQLTSHGKRFFNKRPAGSDDSLAIAKFHKRFVRETPPNFSPLIEDNEGFISHSGQIITFQGHPEMDKATAAMCMEEDDGAYTGGRTEAQIDELTGEFVTDDHDGILIFEHIIGWARQANGTAAPRLPAKL